MLPTVLEPFVYPQSNVPCSARSTTLNRKNWQGYLKSLLSTGARPSPSSPRRFPLQALILKEEQLQSPPRAQDLCCECSDSPFINRTLISPKTPNSRLYQFDSYKPQTPNSKDTYGTDVATTDCYIILDDENDEASVQQPVATTATPVSPVKTTVLEQMPQPASTQSVPAASQAVAAKIEKMGSSVTEDPEDCCFNPLAVLGKELCLFCNNRTYL